MSDYITQNATRGSSSSLRGLLIAVLVLVFGLVMLSLFSGGSERSAGDGASALPALETAPATADPATTDPATAIGAAPTAPVPADQ